MKFRDVDASHCFAPASWQLIQSDMRRSDDSSHKRGEP